MTLKHRISLDQVHEAARTVDLVFLHSPCYEDEALGAAIGRRIVLKVETVNPIRCFKGRGADYLVARASPGAPLMTASAGNFGQAMAYACRRRGVGLTVYAAETANPLKVARMRALGAQVVIAGADFDAAKEAARRQAATSGVRFVEDGRDIETLAGAGTIALEWLEAGLPDTLLIPLGNGALLNGIARVVKARRPATRVVAVQAAGAPAMVESWRAGVPIVRDRIDTIADGIGVRVPIEEAVRDMAGIVDQAVLVSEQAIVEAMGLIHRHAGLVAEPSAAVGVAALREHGNVIEGERVGTVICGSNLTAAQMGQWL